MQLRLERAPLGAAEATDRRVSPHNERFARVQGQGSVRAGDVREVREYRGWENNCWGLWKGEELVGRGKR